MLLTGKRCLWVFPSKDSCCRVSTSMSPPSLHPLFVLMRTSQTKPRARRPICLARPPRPFNWALTLRSLLSARSSRCTRGGVPACEAPVHACHVPSSHVQGLDPRSPPVLRPASTSRLLPDTSRHPLPVYILAVSVAACRPSTVTCATASCLSTALSSSRTSSVLRLHMSSLGFFRPFDDIPSVQRPTPGLQTQLCCLLAVSRGLEALFRTSVCSPVSCRCRPWDSARQSTVLALGFLRGSLTCLPACPLRGVPPSSLSCSHPCALPRRSAISGGPT